jgi:hypothetical protein
LIIFRSLTVQASDVFISPGLGPTPKAVVTEFKNQKILLAETDNFLFKVGDYLPVYSESMENKSVGYVQILKIDEGSPRKLYCLLLRHSRDFFIKPGDYLLKIDLSTQNNEYLGGTELLVRTQTPNVSARYKPLLYQGLTVGYTAEVLKKDENMINFLGNYSYGVDNDVMATAFIPGFFFKFYNLGIKKQFFASDLHILSVAGNVFHDQEALKTQGTVQFFWDSINSGNQIAHTMLTLNIEPFRTRDREANIITGTSLQTGYEFITDKWDRILLGPRYNFDLKSVGGYFNYVYIWDEFHLILSAATADITYFKMDPNKGFIVGFDMYWRYE